VTIHGVVADGRTRLGRAGIPAGEAELDARLLAEFALGWDAARFLANADRAADPTFLAAYRELLDRRARREPLAYITGEKAFWKLSFTVSPAVLIPRPETELIVEAALARFPAADLPFSMADVCTGSGCLAISLAHERPRASVLATDISSDALAVATRNAVRHEVDDRIEFIQTDLLAAVQGTFDLIVANPPYIPEYERASLQPEVRDHEPAVALFAGAGGLAVIRRLLDESLRRLRPGGWLIFEFGAGQAEPVRLLLGAMRGWSDVEVKPDLAGIPRTAIARRIQA
jgi:release factor glutamine methyltransferase